MNRVQNAIRNRFHRHDKNDDDNQSQASTSSDQAYMYQMMGEKDADEVSINSVDSNTLGSDGKGNVIDGHLKDGNSEDEKAVYEQQLTQLQEQLVSVMIDNQNLASDLKEATDSNLLDSLREELEKEREKCQQLQQQLQEIKQQKPDDNGTVIPTLETIVREVTPGVEMASAADDFVHVSDDKDEIVRPLMSSEKKKSLYGSVWEYVLNGIYQFMEDLEPIEPSAEADEEGAPLTVKQLKENIKRFKTAITPFINTVSGVQKLISWKSPGFTCMVFFMYMYAAYNGYILPLALFLVTFRLAISYFKHRGFNINFNYLEYEEEEKKDTEDKGVSDKFNLVLFVARKVQNILGSWADSLEKIKNLITWNEPKAARTIFSFLFVGFIVSLVCETSVIFYFAVMYLGVKVFVIDFIYNRYPRLKRKHDTTYIIWLSLPTDAELEKRSAQSEIKKHILSMQHRGSDSEVYGDSQGDHMTSDDKSFCELFSLPSTECPLPGWHGGKRCTLINKDKSLTGTFKNGRLFLTRSFLCFERSKTPTPKNLVIPLSDIAKIEKAKPYGWMPGGGMAIEITLSGTEKPLMFGAFLNRDDSFVSILRAGAKGGQPWAQIHIPAIDGATQKNSSTHQKQNSERKQFSNFTVANPKC